MTLPNGLSGIADVIGRVFATTGNPALVSGYGLNPISAMEGLNQNFVMEILKANVIQVSAGWNSATAALWAGLRRGNPIDGAVGFALALIEPLVAQLLGLPIGTWGTVEDALAAIEGLPGVAQIIAILTQVGGTITDYEEVLQTWAFNLVELFSGIDLNDPDLDIFAALTSWVTTNVLPLITVAISDVTGLAGYLTNLTSGGILALAGLATGAIPAGITLPGSQLTGAVAAALVSGVLSAGNIPALAISGITGLTGYLTNLTSGGVLALAGLATGAIPAGITLPGSQLTGAVAAALVSGVLSAGNIPALAISGITGLSGYLTNLTSGGVLALTGLASGALPGGVTAAISNVTGLGGYLTNLTSGGVLALTGLATGAIPAGITLAGSAISSVLAQANIPSLTGAWGGSIAGSLISGALSAATLAGSAITGSISAALISGALALSNIPALTGAWAGTVAGSLLTGSVAASLISGVTASEQSIVNYINAAVGQATGGALSTVQSALQQIPQPNIIGQWSTTLNSDLSALLTNATIGVAGPSVAANLANFQTALSGITTQLGYLFGGTPPAVSTTGITTTNNDFIAKRAATKPSFFGLDPSADVVFNLSQMSGASPTTIPVTQTASVIGMIGIPDGGVAGTANTTWPLKKSIAWLGSGPTTTTITEMYIDIYRVDVATGASTRVHVSPNLIIAGVSPTLAWNYYNIANAIDYIPVGQGEWYAVEMRIVGSGTYNIVGLASTWMPAHPTVFPKAIGATRGIDTRPTVRTVGTYATATASTSATANTTLNIATGDYIVASTVELSFTTSSIQAYCNGVAMTALNDFLIYNSGGTISRVALWGITQAAAGTTGSAVAVSATCVATSANISVESLTLVGVSSVGATSTATGTATAGAVMTKAAPVTPSNTTIITAFGAWVAGPLTTFTGGTVRGTVTGNVIMGDAAGTGGAFNQTAVATAATAPYNWGAVSVIFNGIAGAAPSTLPTFNAIGGATPAYSSSIPWFAMCGSAGLSQHPPDLSAFSASGTYTKPLWANFFDIIVFGAGGGGVGGVPFAGGTGGNAGVVSSTTYSAATVASASTFAVTVGAAGGAGPSGGTAGNGGTSSVAGTGFTTVSAAGGAGGNGVTGSIYGAPGANCGNTTVNGETYYGGGGGASGQAAGGQPGGGGAGGNATVAVGSYVGGGGGGAGAVYILAYQ